MLVSTRCSRRGRRRAGYAVDAVCFVYTCRRLIDLSLIAGTAVADRRGAAEPQGGLAHDVAEQDRSEDREGAGVHCETRREGHRGVPDQ